MTSLQEEHPLRARFAGMRQESEPRLQGVLQSLLTMEDLFDLTLRGSDGTLVRANRCVLASRSSVFLGLLYGPFKESSNSVVDVGYEGKVIQALVKYIYTNQVPARPTQSNFGDEDNASENAGNLEFMRFLVALIDASEYFAFSALRRMTESSVNEMIMKNDKLAIHGMAVCAPDCDLTKALRDTALGLVKKTPDILIHGAKSVVALIPPSYLEEILKQERLPMTEYLLSNPASVGNC
jgi:BTB/POZ domain